MRNAWSLGLMLMLLTGLPARAEFREFREIDLTIFGWIEPPAPTP
jgi:hypothetical protein